MQVFPHTLPLVQWGGCEVDVAFDAGVTVAGRGQATNLWVFGSLHCVAA